MYLSKVPNLLNYVVQKPIIVYNWCVRLFIFSNGTPSNDVIVYHYAMTPQVGILVSLVYGM
jgi:hypothetical protein